jgi:succinate dehydrogenase / fumarate reductase, cytochrome b subunit
MQGKKKGPRNIGVFDLIRYRFPLSAIASILHRVSGVILFLMIPGLLYLLDFSLVSENNYRNMIDLFHSPGARLLLWLGMSSLIYHVLAGLKHLLMDFGLFEGLKTSKYSSMVVMLLGALYAVFLGVVLW